MNTSLAAAVLCIVVLNIWPFEKMFAKGGRENSVSFIKKTASSVRTIPDRLSMA
jgi:hypothetical protein